MNGARCRVEGFSLIEVLIALGIVAYMISAVLGLLPSGMKVADDADGRSEASGVVHAVAEAVRAAARNSSDPASYDWRFEGISGSFAIGGPAVVSSWSPPTSGGVTAPGKEGSVSPSSSSPRDADRRGDCRDHGLLAGQRDRGMERAAASLEQGFRLDDGFHPFPSGIMSTGFARRNHDRTDHPGGADGHTLVELLAAVAVVTMMMVLIMQIVQGMFEATRSQSRRIEATESARRVLDVLAADIESVPWGPGPPCSRLPMRGQTS